MFRYPIATLLFILSSSLHAQWSQLGQNIAGEVNSGDNFGSTSSINAEGNVFVAGDYHNADSGEYAGHVRVFELEGDDWIQRGADIDGIANEWLGFRVDIDSSGNTIALTSIYGDNDEGYRPGLVRIFDWDGVDWLQRGANIVGVGHPTILEWYGSGISLSADGNTIAIGGPSHTDPNFRAGFVQIYNWNGTEWIQLGTDLEGDGAYDEFGYALDLNAAGNVLAVGAQGNFGFGLKPEGYVKVFEWDGADWIQHGSTINGELAGDEFGRSVSLSAIGDVVAIGAPGYEIVPMNLACQAYVYAWDGTDWLQRGNTFTGSSDINRLGESISLNSTGNILAVGATNFSASGEIQVFKWIDNGWVQEGSDILGEEVQDVFGSSLCLNASGNTVLGGAWGSGDVGQVRVFKNETLVGITDLETVELSIHPNPAQDQLTIAADTHIETVIMRDLQGRVLIVTAVNGMNIIMDISALAAGNYVVEIITDSSSTTQQITKH